MTKTTDQQTAIDPVCGQGLNSEAAEYAAHHEAKLYYFCSDACKRKFLEDPTEYVSA